MQTCRTVLLTESLLALLHFVVTAVASALSPTSRGDPTKIPPTVKRAGVRDGRSEERSSGEAARRRVADMLAATSVESRGKPKDALMTPGQHESLSALAPFDYTALDYLQ